MTNPAVLPLPESTVFPAHDRLVVNVAGVAPDQLADAVAGFALTIRATP
jgi:hypothetical protein